MNWNVCATNALRWNPRIERSKDLAELAQALKAPRPDCVDSYCGAALANILTAVGFAAGATLGVEFACTSGLAAQLLGGAAGAYLGALPLHVAGRSVMVSLVLLDKRAKPRI